jgi:NNP family nitrate/nitrite transporter-like MFS transporter
MKGASSTQQGLFFLGALVAGAAFCAIAVRFSGAHKAAEQRLYDEAVAARTQLASSAVQVSA